MLQFTKPNISKLPGIHINKKYHVEISCPPIELQQEFKILFTEESLTFLSELFWEFDRRIDQVFHPINTN